MIRPLELMLLASIIGVAVCGVWAGMMIEAMR